MPAKACIQPCMARLAEEQPEIGVVCFVYFFEPPLHQRAGRALPPAVLPRCDAANSPDADGAMLPSRIAEEYRRVTDNLIVPIEAEKTLVRLRPHHVSPWQCGHDFSRPDRHEQWRSVRPAGIPFHDFDVIDHHRPAKGSSSRT